MSRIVKPYHLQDRFGESVGGRFGDLQRRILASLPTGPVRHSQTKIQQFGTGLQGPAMESVISGPIRGIDYQSFSIATRTAFIESDGNFSGVVILGYYNSGNDNWFTGLQETNSVNQFQYVHRLDSNNHVSRFSLSLPLTAWFWVVYDGTETDFYVYDADDLTVLDSDTKFSSTSDPSKPREVAFECGNGPGYGGQIGFLFDGPINETDRVRVMRNAGDIIRPRNRAVFTVRGILTADGSVTDGSETVSGDVDAVPTADGSVTDGGETVSGDAYSTVTADGSVTDSGETVSGDADTVPAADGSVTDGGETVSGEAYARVAADGSLTDGGETVSGTADFQLQTGGFITDGSETVGGFATNSVGRDKALLRSDLDGTVIAFRSGSLNVTTRMNACDSATFSVHLRAGDERPLETGEPISLYADERQEDKIWSGTVDRYREDDLIHAENYSRIVRYECVCYSALADRYHVSGSYRDEIAGDIVRDFIDTYLANEGVTAGEIEDGPTITKANFSYTPISQALNDLSDETGFSWFIGPDKQLHFRSRTSTLGSLTIDDDNKPFRTFHIERGRRQYRNRQVVRGGKGLTNERTETFVGDGESQTFTTVFNLAEEPTIEVNGTPQDVGISGLEEDKDFYWNKGSNTIAQDDGATPLTSGDTLTITYVGLVPIAVESSDQDQIDARSEVEGGAGIYENVVTDSSIEENEAALERAEGLLRRFARVDERVSFELDVLSVRQGQLIEIDLPTREVSGQYLLDEVSFEVKDNNELRANVTALSGEAYGSWTKYFRELVQAKQEFTVRENELVLLQRRASETQQVVDSISTSADEDHDFIVGADGTTPGDGSSIIGFVDIGATSHEENTPSESQSTTDTASTSTSALTFTIGTDEVGFSAIG